MYESKFLFVQLIIQLSQHQVIVQVIIQVSQIILSDDLRATCIICYIPKFWALLLNFLIGMFI